MMKKYLPLALLLILSILVVFTPQVSAHRSGCHRWHSCPSDSGSYVCGDTGHSNYCGGETYQRTTPVITTKQEVYDTPIPYTTTTTENTNEYTGYKHLVTEGKAGIKRSTITVTYSDNIETSRVQAVETTIAEPTPEVFSVGTRKKPTGFIDYISNGDDKKFLWFTTKRYNVHVYGEANKNYALIKNNSVIELGKTGTNGDAFFWNIELKSGDSLEIGTYSGGKILWFMPRATSTSEKTYVNLENLTLLTAYDKQHDRTSTPAYNQREDKKTCSDEIKRHYLESRTQVEKLVDEASEAITIYYPEPCTIEHAPR